MSTVDLAAHPVATGVSRERLARLDTAALSDALDSLGIAGVLPGLAARVPGAVAFGPAYTVRYRPVADRAGFRNAANYLDEVPAGAVVVIDNGGSLTCTNWGSLLTAVARSRGLAGTVLHGSARDLAEVRELGYPLHSTGVTMVSGKNRVELDRVQVELEIGGTAVAPGDLIFADDNGVLCVPAARLAEVVDRAERVDATERRIRAAVEAGSRLDEARAAYRYDRPWEGLGAGAGAGTGAGTGTGAASGSEGVDGVR
ncbi:dimethylmenaquinone methyltransferase [Kitasatospora sp. MMS16-BH015]|uniref:RraA family protein n=1 Tax=Kitasatospora sp. MMS16-BH015 TaxID=2018025 RepID=UPI000CA22557|nr:S-adenosylmethionine--2-demethylmenaquinone methyltransferase [Kitasatospora sp. MMS16-BH015]AUG78462.1 dimethylmenaquinone methyltransferase [Kitasatospora sp. MMS16-BH015]